MRISMILAVFILMTGLPLTAPGSPVQAQPPQPPQLRLHRGTFDARSTMALGPTAAWASAAPGPYAIIQLWGPITVADRVAVEQTGVTLLEYLPDYAYLVRGSAAQLEAAARLPQVYARTPFTLADKLAPALLLSLRQGSTLAEEVRITGWPDDQGSLIQDLQAVGGSQQLTASDSQLLQVAALESVRWIEPV
ncbi:MAG: hypothetical protein R3264_14885, partial [Anaerolineae bacterium]|nr:hypothetical protein [Anaerolineae bacterium]